MLLVACGDSKKEKDQTYLPSSNGDLNHISVVVDNALWENNVGESIRNIFAVPLTGLPVDEPLFNLKQVPSQVFEGKTTLSRIILKIEKGSEPATKITNETYAKPQTLVTVSGNSDQDIITQLNENKAKIIDAFNKEEVGQKQRLIKKSLLNASEIEKRLGFSANIPTVYRIAKAEDDFFWIRKNIKNNKTIELMLYEVPMEAISKGDSTIVDIVKMRNQVTKTKIPGEDDIYMKVEDAYAPALFNTIIDNKPAYEVRGLWETVGYTMAGPFVTYAIEDRVNNRYVIADGYVYAPSLDKRDYVFELEAIIKSITIK
jgi:hypothetical protein